MACFRHGQVHYQKKHRQWHDMAQYNHNRKKGKTEDSNYNKNKLKKDTSRISLLVSFDN